MNSKISFVVSRFNEDLSWTNNLDNVIVYNKGERLSNCSYQVLFNVGREGHTYASHIYSNYNNLTDYVCFLQGNPFDHTKKLFDKIEQFKSDPQPFFMLSDMIYTFDLKNGCSHHPNLPLQSVYKQIFNKENDNTLIFGAGAQFIVRRDFIRNRPRETYETIRNMLSNENNPIEGFCIERLWPTIFNPDI